MAHTTSQKTIEQLVEMIIQRDNIIIEHKQEIQRLQNEDNVEIYQARQELMELRTQWVTALRRGKRLQRRLRYLHTIILRKTSLWVAFSLLWRFVIWYWHYFLRRQTMNDTSTGINSPIDISTSTGDQSFTSGSDDDSMDGHAHVSVALDQLPHAQELQPEPTAS